MDVDRARALAYRIAAQGLHRDGRLDAVLSLGLQHTGAAATVALAARQPDGAMTGPAASTDPAQLGLVTAWTHRGAPHHHLPPDLGPLAAASRPLSDADAAARLSWSGPEQRRIGIGGLDAVDRTADALADAVVAPMTKGAASAAVTSRLAPGLLRDCRPCGCTHVHEQLMRLSASPAGLGLDAWSPTLLLLPPAPGWVRPRGAGDPRVAAALVHRVVRALGPTTPAHVAGFVGSTTTAFGPAWDAAVGELLEVRVDGVRAWVASEDADAVADPPEPDLVRLLPPSDPLLQGRDRELLVPDADRRAALYRALGNPGAVLADGEIVGAWRPKASAGRLTVTVEEFEPLTPHVRAGVAEEAERVAEARGMTLRSVARDG